jgi:hypothetical protein
MKQSIRINLVLASFLQIACVAWGQANYSDCDHAQMLCDKTPIVINQLSGSGDFSESSLGTCFRNDFQETNSVWLKWKVANPGSLTFTILPLVETDDLDFVLYRIRNFDHCVSKEVVRCMAAGPVLGTESGNQEACTGATGLHAGVNGAHLGSGCSKFEKNFLQPLDMLAGEYYTLFINNFRSSSGIYIEWGGTGSFQQIAGQCLPQTSASPSPVLGSSRRLQFSTPFPNPASDRVYISALSEEAQTGQLQIIGSDGQIELSRPFVISAGGSTLELPTESLRNGVHFIKLRTDAETQVLRFEKH